MTFDDLPLGEQIKQLRLEKGWTQKELGDRLGKDQPAIGKWERGVNTPSEDSIQKLAEIFGHAFSVPEQRVSASQSGARNPMLESAKQVIKMHGYEIVARDEYEIWSKVRRMLGAQRPARASGDDPLTRL